VAASGTVEPIRTVEVKSQASGEILSLEVEVGDYVERGQVLVRIDPRDVRNTYEQGAADLEVARARFTIAERQLGRIRSLHDSAVVTDEELEAATLEHANANAALVKAQTNLELARDRLNDVVVTAPISGTVVTKSVEEGAIVSSTNQVSGGTTLLLMADLAEVQVRTLVDETDIGQITPGQPAAIQVEAYPDQAFEGTVLMVEPQATLEQNVTMFAVLTRIRNEGDLLRPGMNADVEMEIGSRDDVLALPNQAVKTPEEAEQLAEVLEIALPDPAEATGAAAPEGGGPGERPDGGPDLRSMSAEERRAAFESMTAEQRSEMQARMRQVRAAREREAAEARANPGRPRAGYVFVRDEAGALALQPVQLGLSTWEHTEIVSGLAEGDAVVVVPQSLIQQREMLDRVRSRSGVPGVQRQ
ncbi:MAG TPA: efflux RND transporter periplasmic adaptor subunit, partial [Gemmatimonadota bacterium]|nr:efflux RND transporter periplasmic adaptor subunit [Gemmatimonadota bacterium]